MVVPGPELKSSAAAKLRVLDCGCGAGTWVLELAAVHPGWQITGIDRNAERIERTDRRRKRLGIENARFVAGDCLKIENFGPFDLVLSVNSAHYALPAGNGREMFERFRDWLDPRSGVLLLLVPWCRTTVPTDEHRDSPPRGFVSAEQLLDLCEAAGLEVETMAGCIGPLGIMAKGLALKAQGSAALSAAVYPLELMLSFLDRQITVEVERSAAVMLKAKRNGHAAFYRKEE